MSEFSTHKAERLSDLKELFDAIVNKKNASETILKFQPTTIANVTPDDVVMFVHLLVEWKYPMEEIKSGINKLLNVLRKSLDNYPYSAPEKETFFDICIKNNEEVIKRLNKIRPYILQINKEVFSDEIRESLISLWTDIQQFANYYLIKENIIFPLIEKHIPDYKCVSIMWSIHDDIRRDIQNLIEKLHDNNTELKTINQLTGDIFYNIYAIVFREERLLYPFMQKFIDADVIEKMWNESVESGFPFVNPMAKKLYDEPEKDEFSHSGMVDLKSGFLTAEQIILIFNHLPVDITYVDENDKVLFYSTPKDRIFHRTNAVIGRNVHNCHPKESVHVVEKIVDAFKNGTKESANFWISMRNGKRVLIQYFAVRDEDKNYKGVIEVSQEISEIQKLEGDRRILDWENE